MGCGAKKNFTVAVVMILPPTGAVCPSVKAAGDDVAIVVITNSDAHKNT